MRERPVGETLMPWQLVASSAGRDEGQFYLVLGVEKDGFVRVVDGAKRTDAKPKRKNPRHLVSYPVAAAELEGLAAQGREVGAADVRRALQRLVREAAPEDEGRPCP